VDRVLVIEKRYDYLNGHDNDHLYIYIIYTLYMHHMKMETFVTHVLWNYKSEYFDFVYKRVHREAGLKPISDSISK
jgi:hypothetical protein